MNKCVNSSVKVIACLAAFGAFPVFAEGDVAAQTKVNTGCCAEALKGFTVGADVIYSHAAAKHEELETKIAGVVGNVDVAGNDNSYSSLEHKRAGLDPSVNIGYTHVYKNWYVGVAGEFAFGVKSKRNSDFGGAKVDTEIGRTSYGLKVKGGYFVNDLKSAIYGIAGIKWRDVKFRFNVDEDKGTDAKLKRPLYVIGVGVERPVYKKLSVSAEYEYAWRNSKDTSTVDLTSGSASLYAKQRLNEHSFRVGVKYHV